MKPVVLICLFLVACGPSTSEDIQKQGEAECLKLSVVLHQIDTREELLRAIPKVKKSYNRIADLVLQVRKIGEFSEEIGPSEASDRLFVELARLYEIPGCRELMENAQKEAVERLKK